MKSKAIVVGSGIAGLAVAIRLACKGFEVDVYDKNEYPGGKLTSIEKNGFRFDAGPSLFTLPDQVDELFRLADEIPSEHFQYKRLHTTCHYFWDDGLFLPASADIRTFSNQVEELLGVPANVVVKYLKKSRFIYDVTAPVFLHRSLHVFKNFLNFETLRGIIQIPRLGIFKSLHQANVHQLKNQRLVQLFDRYATYNGSNPYEAPGVLQSISSLEFTDGAFFPRGGMHSITTALVELAKRKGVTFHLNTPVERILVQSHKAYGISVEGQTLQANVIVCNADIMHAYKNLLPDVKPPVKTLQQPRSSSALIFYWGIQKIFSELHMHNIFFSNDYAEEFRFIFEEKLIYFDPTIYINITSLEEKGDAPEGCQNWFVMINVPNNIGQDWELLIAEARINILKKLSKRLGQDIKELIMCEEILDPRSIESKTSSWQGSLYGSSSNNRNAAFLRHANKHQHIQNLYFCGGSAHPGGGIPLCLQSARIVSDLVVHV